ncbi:MAG: hypothetical protein ACPG55_09850, partial [Luminiphilus sp.]
DVDISKLASSGENCTERFLTWAQAVAGGDMQTAERILRDANDIGYEGLALGYFSSLLETKVTK